MSIVVDGLVADDLQEFAQLATLSENRLSRPLALPARVVEVLLDEAGHQLARLCRRHGMGRRFRRCLAVHDAIKRCLAAGGEVLKRLDFNFHELAHESRTVSVAEGNVLQAQQTIGNGPVVAAVTELVLPLQPLESRLTGTKDRVEKHLLKLRVFHKVGKVAVRRAFDLDPIVLRKLDDFAPPEGDFILVDLLQRSPRHRKSSS